MKNANRVVLLVIDGFGVGAMKDIAKSRTQDKGSNTFRSIKEGSVLKYPNLEALGIDRLNKKTGLEHGKYFIRRGTSKLHYSGADSYLGHKEIIGIPVNVKKIYLGDHKKKIEALLRKNNLEFYWYKKEVLVVEKEIFVGNNVESDLGNNINVYGNLSKFKFKDILKIGKLFRDNFECSRVIVHGVNPSLDEKKVSGGFVFRRDQALGKRILGISSGKMKIHNGKQSVIHMGYQDENRNNLIDRFIAKKIPILMVGKTADMFGNKVKGIKNSQSINVVHTGKMIEIMKRKLKTFKKGFIFANFQEVDLSGHNQDKKTAGKVLSMIDGFLPFLIETLNKNDLLIITADHGNDPAIGHDMHTREFVPVISLGKTIKPGLIGTRRTLSDIASTVCEFYNLPKIKTGKSFLK